MLVSNMARNWFVLTKTFLNNIAPKCREFGRDSRHWTLGLDRNDFLIDTSFVFVTPRWCFGCRIFWCITPLPLNEVLNIQIEIENGLPLFLLQNRAPDVVVPKGNQTQPQLTATHTAAAAVGSQSIVDHWPLLTFVLFVQKNSRVESKVSQ